MQRDIPAPGPRGGGAPGGYVEVRTRSGWGTFWRVTLAVWSALCVLDVAVLVVRASAVRAETSGLGHLLVDNVLSAKMVQSAVIWLVGAAALGVACLLTPSRRSWVPIEPPRAPLPPLVRGGNRPPPDATALGRDKGDGAAVGVAVAVLALIGLAVLIFGNRP